MLCHFVAHLSLHTGKASVGITGADVERLSHEGLPRHARHAGAEVATCDLSDPTGCVSWQRLPMGPFSSSSSLVSTICAGSGDFG